MSIDLLRHGDTGQRSYRGQLDDPLTELGWRQLREAVEGREWDRVVSSSMSRCARFAAELAEQRGLPLRIDARLAEYHFGDWQGVPIEDIAKNDGDALGRFWADPVAHPPPGAETFEVFHARLADALADVAREASGTCVHDVAGEGEKARVSDNVAMTEARVLVVTHGGAIRLLRCFAERRGFGDMAGLDVPHASLHPIIWHR
jgi:alpha-ribazole phosphatase